MNLLEIFNSHRVFYDGNATQKPASIWGHEEGEDEPVTFFISIDNEVDLEVSVDQEVNVQPDGRFIINVNGHDYLFSAYAPAW